MCSDCNCVFVVMVMGDNHACKSQSPMPYPHTNPNHAHKQ